MVSKYSVLVRLALVLTTATITLNGIDMAFSVYAIPLKETFNFTQTQVELMSSLDVWGMGLGLLEIPLHTGLGYKFVYLLSWVTMVMSSGFLSLAAKYSHVFKDLKIALYTAQLLMATSNQVVYMATSRAALTLINSKHIGRFLGVMCAAASFGKVVFGGLRDLFFSDDLAAFFCVLSSMSLVIIGSCFLTFHSVVGNVPEYSKLDDQDKANVSSIECSESSTKQMLSSSFFHLTFWPSVIFYACPFTILNNITTIANSTGLVHPLGTVYTQAISMILMRLLFGVMSDRFTSHLAGFGLLFAAQVSFGIAILLGLFSLRVETVYVMSVLNGIAFTPGYTVTTSMLMREFGRSHYSHISGIFYAVLPITFTILQLMIGNIYDLHTGELSRFCHGSSCFLKSFSIVAVILIVCIAVQFTNCMLTSFVHRNKK